MRIYEVHSDSLAIALVHAGWKNSPEEIAALRTERRSPWRINIRWRLWKWA